MNFQSCGCQILFFSQYEIMSSTRTGNEDQPALVKIIPLSDAQQAEGMMASGKHCSVAI